MHQGHEKRWTNINLGKDWPFHSQRLPLGHSRSYAAVNYSEDFISDTLRAPDSLHLHLKMLKNVPKMSEHLQPPIMTWKSNWRCQKGTTKHETLIINVPPSHAYTPNQCWLEVALLGSFSTPAAKSSSFLSKPFNANDNWPPEAEWNSMH